jgi:hypothetical protein
MHYPFYGVCEQVHGAHCFSDILGAARSRYGSASDAVRGHPPHQFEVQSHSGSMYQAPLILMETAARRASPLLANFKAESRSPHLAGTIAVSHIETGRSVLMWRSNRIRNIGAYPTIISPMSAFTLRASIAATSLPSTRGDPTFQRPLPATSSVFYGRG